MRLYALLLFLIVSQATELFANLQPVVVGELIADFDVQLDSSMLRSSGLHDIVLLDEERRKSLLETMQAKLLAVKNKIELKTAQFNYNKYIAEQDVLRSKRFLDEILELDLRGLASLPELAEAKDKHQQAKLKYSLVAKEGGFVDLNEEENMLSKQIDFLQQPNCAFVVKGAHFFLADQKLNFSKGEQIGKWFSDYEYVASMELQESALLKLQNAKVQVQFENEWHDCQVSINPVPEKMGATLRYPVQLYFRVENYNPHRMFGARLNVRIC